VPGKPRILRRPRSPSIGWREWVALPDLGIPAIKVKVDTGARSSALHAFDIRREVDGGVTWVRFRVHPIQRDVVETVRARAALADERVVRSSSGKATRRAVITTRVVVGPHVWPIEVTLVRRDLMGFRMLLGRQAVRGRFLVHPGRSFLLGEPAPALRGGPA
jgi:hypothetical protein